MGFEKASCRTRVGVTSSEVDRSGVASTRKQQSLAMSRLHISNFVLRFQSFRRGRTIRPSQSLSDSKGTRLMSDVHYQKHLASTFELDFWTSGWICSVYKGQCHPPRRSLRKLFTTATLLSTMQLSAILSAFIFGCIVVQATPLSTATGREGAILSKTVRISTLSIDVHSSRIISLTLFATNYVGVQYYSRGGFKLRACQPRPSESRSRGYEGHQHRSDFSHSRNLSRKTPDQSCHGLLLR